MKNTFPALLAVILCAGAAADAAAKTVSRKMGGAVLGMTIEKSHKRLKANEAPKILADMALPGEEILIFPGAKAKGVGHFIGHFRNGKLRRLEWTYDKGSDWG